MTERSDEKSGASHGRPPRLVITGASGFVGRELVPLLLQAGAELLLVGRDPSRLGALFPGVPVASYRDLAAQGAGSDAFVHLAILNDDEAGDEASFRAVDGDLLMETVESAKSASVSRFVNVSSFHVLDPRNQAPDSNGNTEAARRLQGVTGIGITNVFLPLVYGRRWSGRLSFLNRLPPALARPVFTAFAALKPTLEIRRLAEALLDIHRNKIDGDVLVSDMQEGNSVYRFGKRATDLLFAIAIVTVLWWAFILIWAAIKLQGSGPGIFAQERVGREGRSFTCYKFRTMKTGTKQVGTHEAPFDSVTPLGRKLRAMKLDELPQVVNVLRGDMSLVGPRPCLPSQRRLVEERTRRGVLKIRPGITGLAQVRGVDMSDAERLARLDELYLAQQSLVLDLKLIIATVRGSGRGDRIVRQS